MKTTILIAFGCDDSILRRVSQKLQRISGGKVFFVTEKRETENYFREIESLVNH